VIRVIALKHKILLRNGLDWLGRRNGPAGLHFKHGPSLDWTTKKLTPDLTG
jgi:hypothetical protein